MAYVPRAAPVEKPIGGVHPDGRQLAPGLPTHWMTYFAVDDCDAKVEQVKSLGGMVMVPPTDLPVGRFAVVGDPAQAVFSVIKLTNPM